MQRIIPLIAHITILKPVFSSHLRRNNEARSFYPPSHSSLILLHFATKSTLSQHSILFRSCSCIRRIDQRATKLTLRSLRYSSDWQHQIFVGKSTWAGAVSNPARRPRTTTWTVLCLNHHRSADKFHKPALISTELDRVKADIRHSKESIFFTCDLSGLIFTCNDYISVFIYDIPITDDLKNPKSNSISKMKMSSLQAVLLSWPEIYEI